jgi:predicted AlkP superfamily phosphohydrolase/phosphomutase
MTNTPHKVLILGLDGATWTILKPLMDKGKLPNITALVKSGASGILNSAIPPVTAPAWTNFQTGSNMGKHGIFDFRIFNRGKRQVWLSSSRDIKLPTLWQIASASDRRVIAINVPMTFPPQPVNGIIIGGMLARNEDKSLLYPSERFDEIFGKHPDYRISSPIVSRRGVMGRSAYVDANINVEHNRFNLARDLMKNEPWDIFMLQNQSLDYIQHSYFPLMDPESKGYDHKGYDDVTRFYQAMDENIGDLVESTPPDTDILVISDHGFKLQNRLIHLAPWLRNKGYLVEDISSSQRLLQFIRKYDVFKLRRHFAHWILRDKKTRFEKASVTSLNRIDWERSRAYTAIGSNFGCIYINQENVDDKDIFLDMITEELSELIDPQNGRRVVKCIYRSDELFQGPYTHNAPDLIAEPEKYYAFGAPAIVSHENIFTEVDYYLEMPGGHHPEGMFIWTGSDVKKGSDFRANLMDIAPTILARLQIPIPNHMDGHVLESFFKTPLSANSQEWDFDHDLYSEKFFFKQDEDHLSKRLSDLGYL